MQAHRLAPPDMICNGKFLVQSIVVPAGTTDKDFSSSLAPSEDVEDSKMVKSEEVRPANDVEYKTMKDVEEPTMEVEHKRPKNAEEPAKDVEHETMKYEEEPAKLSELKSTAKPG
ncbi:vesicle-associated protein 2-2-like [Actinidia eriantha]|uniref:vesicle-associated protein 2-2-like n=1 Tax=Actinidia eriantha TaxID=165200 RepID=UPI002584CA8E|nr:vesicle-associated protein 2-2-like [Actinidia eriantha]